MNKYFSKHGKPILPSLDFSKRKINKVTLGLDKWKHRVVAGGHRQDPSQYVKSDISSPTLDHNTLLMFLSTIMREEGIEFSTADFPGAYLASDIDEEIYMNIDAKKVAILLQDPEFQFLVPYVRADGTILTQIQKGIYGLKQASRLWNKNIDSHLRSMGFTPTAADPCLYIKHNSEGISYIALYVDDLVIATKDPQSNLNYH
jgi:hypothetical protein